jgi:hypothetical protein
MRLLDPRFRYVPAAKTDVLTTWRRFGFRPMTDSERRARQRAPAPEYLPALAELALAGETLRSDRRSNRDLTLAG